MKGLIALCGLAIVGCAKQAEPKVADVAKDSTPKVLTVFTWEDYFDMETIAQFEENTGTKIVYETYESTDEMQARLLSEPGKYDVIVAEGTVLEVMNTLRLTKEFEAEKVPNLKNVGENFRGKDFDPANKFTVPYTWGSTLVAYRTDLIEDPKKSWSLLWDERVKGKVMLYDERQSVLRIPLFLLGHSMSTAEPEHIADATDLLLDRIESSEARFGSDVDVREGLKDGSLFAAMCYSGDAAMVAEDNENIGWFIPDEGAPLWIDCFAITKHTNASDLAHEFVNYMLEPEVSAQNMNYVWYASPIDAAKSHLDPDLLEDEALNPPQEVMERCEWYTKLDSKREEALNEGWLRVLNKVRSRTETASATDGEPGE